MFKKGDYIVCLNTPERYCSFPRNYIFKQRMEQTYLMSELDILGSTKNGWAAVDFKGYEKYGKWRYATSTEIQEYERLGKPFNTLTFTSKEIQYEIY
jgi:hypothetical protein